jgi:hypothetical protein
MRGERYEKKVLDGGVLVEVEEWESKAKVGEKL